MFTQLSIVIPVFNEQAVLPLLTRRLRAVLDEMALDYEVIMVDDGSTDLTPAVLQGSRRTWPELRVLRLRANAGHQAALSAGLQAARGSRVVTMDADLQDPPELLTSMHALACDQDLDVVYAVRNDRSQDSVFKRVTARMFYRLMRTLSGTSAPVDAGDYRLMSRVVVDTVNGLPERNRVLRFVVPALNFPSGRVEYRRDARAAGTSKYSMSRMVRLCIDSVTGFSMAPLRAATYAGLLAGAGAIALALYSLVASHFGHTVAGWTSMVLIVSGLAAVQLIGLGIIGEYVGRIYTQLQNQPTYFVASDTLENLPEDSEVPSLHRLDGGSHSRLVTRVDALG